MQTVSVVSVQVWVSSVTEIRPEDLRAQDLDSPPEELHFMVTPPSNGHLALKSAPMTAVLNFTQAHIERGQLLFVHKGKILELHLVPMTKPELTVNCVVSFFNSLQLTQSDNASNMTTVVLCICRCHVWRVQLPSE